MFFQMVHSKNRYWQKFRLKTKKLYFSNFEKINFFTQNFSP